MILTTYKSADDILQVIQFWGFRIGFWAARATCQNCSLAPQPMQVGFGVLKTLCFFKVSSMGWKSLFFSSILFFFPNHHGCFRHVVDPESHWKQWSKSNPIPSMGLAYLPTWMVDVYGIYYTSIIPVPWMVWEWLFCLYLWLYYSALWGF